MIRIAAVQMDANTAAYVAHNNYLKEPISYLKGKCDCGVSCLSLKDGKLQAELRSFLKNEIMFDYVQYLNKKLHEILAYCEKWRVDLAIFPEYSVPAHSLPFLKKLLVEGKIKMDIIAGSHAILQDNFASYEAIGLDMDGELDLGKAISPILRKDGSVIHTEKLSPSKYDFSIKPGSIKDPVEVLSRTGRSYKYLNLICIDFLHDKQREEIKDYSAQFETADFIVVTAYTPRTDYFQKLSFNYILGYKKPIIFVNGPDGGGTKVFCHFDPPQKQQLYNPHDPHPGSYELPPDEEGILIVGFDPQLQYTVYPTPFTLKASTSQCVVAPMIYAHALDGYHDTQRELERIKSASDIAELLHQNEERVRAWMNYSKVFADKIPRLFMDPYDFSTKEDILFYLEALMFDEDETIQQTATLDDWRIEKIKLIIWYLDKLLRRKESRLTKQESEWINMIKFYYRACLITMQSDPRIKIRQWRRYKKQNEKVKVLIVFNGATPFMFYSKVLKKEYGFSVVTSEENGDLRPSCQHFAEKLQSVQSQYDSILFFITGSDNFIECLKDIRRDVLKAKCVVVCDCDVTRYTEFAKKDFFEFVNLGEIDRNYSQESEQAGKRDLCLDKLVKAIQRLADVGELAWR